MKKLKIVDNVDLKEKLNLFIDDLLLTLEYAKDDDSSKWDKIYGTCIESILDTLKKLDIIVEVVDDKQQ